MVKQNLTRPKDDFWSYLSRPCQIVVVWDDRTTANMDPCLKLENAMSGEFNGMIVQTFET